MKTLLLMRHAKSSFKDHKLEDGKRPLTKRGNRDAIQMGEWITRQGLIPELILSSKAERARHTAEIIIKNSGYQGDVRYTNKLFMVEAEDILDVLQKLPDEVERVMVIGHNPGLESLVQLLTEKIEALPTAGIACLTLPISLWKDLDKETPAELVNLWRPKEIRVDTSSELQG